MHTHTHTRKNTFTHLRERERKKKLKKKKQVYEIVKLLFVLLRFILKNIIWEGKLRRKKRFSVKSNLKSLKEKLKKEWEFEIMRSLTS